VSANVLTAKAALRSENSPRYRQMSLINVKARSAGALPDVKDKLIAPLR
jgi:hypothetical protein